MTAFGRSRARRVEPTGQDVTFADVAGIDDAKEELAEIVDFLRDPDKYRRLGARIPRGVLLTGAPGTGKTPLARALAGEAAVPFFLISASEFVEMFVGVGASRVRDLFAQAKLAAPAIIFIDELDAIGRSRGGTAGAGGGHDEREQTLNQILTEMDGFDPSIGVHRHQRHEPPGRHRPGAAAAGAIRPPRRGPAARHRRPAQDPRRAHPLGPARRRRRSRPTRRIDAGHGRRGPRELVTEAALLAAHRGHSAVGGHDLGDAMEKLVLGTERRIMLSPQERERTAYHEAGHALVAMLTAGADPVRKVSIIPRGQALGVTFSAPEADRFSYDEDYLRGKLRILLSGRAAERLVHGTVTTGAENDITEATELARHMAGAWGMSDAIGPVAILHDPDRARVALSGESAPETQQVLDSETRRLLDEAAGAATRLLSGHRDRLGRLVRALLEHETLDEPDAYAAAGLPVPHGAAGAGLLPAVAGTAAPPPVPAPVPAQPPPVGGGSVA